MSMVKGKVHFDREPLIDSVEVKTGAAKVIRLDKAWVDALDHTRKAVEISISEFLSLGSGASGSKKSAAGSR